MSQFRRAARAYADRLGWAVFPFVPRTKRPIPENGLHAATRSPSTIEKWWQRTPDANVAVATGRVSGFWVLDLDDKGGGPDWRREQEHLHGEFPVTPEQLTGGGGTHVLFSLPTQRPIRNRAGIATGVDVRGDGGYIVVAPSIHPNGRPYCWDVTRHPLETPLVPAPEWLLQVTLKTDLGLAVPPDEWVRLLAGGADEGSRNDSIARLAGHLLRHGIDPLVALELLESWNSCHCRPPLDDDEVAIVVDSIARAEARRLERIS